MSKHIEHDKLHAVKERSQAIGEFVEWLRENSMGILRWQATKYVCETCGEIPEEEARHNKSMESDASYHHRNNERCDSDVERVPEGDYPIGKTIEQLLADYFDVDLLKLENEKRAILDEIREANP